METYAEIHDNVIMFVASQLFRYFPYICANQEIVIKDKSNCSCNENVLLNFKELCNCVRYDYCTYSLKKLLSFILCTVVKFYLILEEPFLALHALFYAHKQWRNFSIHSVLFKNMIINENINLHTKAWFDLIYYSMLKKWPLHNNRPNRIEVFKIMQLSKIVHASLKSLQDDIPIYDIEERLYN